MKLNSTQVAEKLGISRAAVNTLVKKGVLKDVAETNGKTRHEFWFDSKQVNELRKTYKPRSRSHGQAQPAPMLSGLFTRLDRLEGKLDQLMKMWA